jgi:hypothetical protein
MLCVGALARASTDKTQLTCGWGVNGGDPTSPLTLNSPLLASHQVPTPWSSLKTSTFGFGFRTDSALNSIQLEPITYGVAVWTPDKDGDIAPKFLYLTVRIEATVFGPKGASGTVMPKTLEKLPYGASWIGVPDLKSFEFTGAEATKEKFQDMGYVNLKIPMSYNGPAFSPGACTGEINLPRMSMNISNGATGEMRYTIVSNSTTPPVDSSGQ